MDLIQSISGRQIRITVVGLGYVGLPLAVEFARNGVQVAGYEVDRAKLDRLRAGESYIRDVQSEDIRSLVLDGLLLPTSDDRHITLSDVVIICVPTPCGRDNEPDLSFIRAAARTVASRLKRGHLVILESTSFPGTTEEILQPALEESGLRAGRDFHLAFSPERIDPGNPVFNVRNTAKLVAGTTEEATFLAEAVYSLVAERVVRVSSPRVAEMAKLFENTFRHVNIALANEMAQVCERMGIDVWEVISAAATKPFGFMPFYPGPGVGGHCIPVDPQYLLYKARQYGCTLRFVELANEINDGMPGHVVERVRASLEELGRDLPGSRLLVLGVAYKKDIDDVRESPALKVLELLAGSGASVQYHDPMVPEFESDGLALKSVELTPETLSAADCVIICTDHSSLPYDRVLEHARSIIDTRNALRRMEDVAAAPPSGAGGKGVLAGR